MRVLAKHKQHSKLYGQTVFRKNQRCSAYPRHRSKHSACKLRSSVLIIRLDFMIGEKLSGGDLTRDVAIGSMLR